MRRPSRRPPGPPRSASPSEAPPPRGRNPRRTGILPPDRGWVSMMALHGRWRPDGDGDCSSAGRAPGCDPGCRGFESRQSPRIWPPTSSNEVGGHLFFSRICRMLPQMLPQPSAGHPPAATALTRVPAIGERSDARYTRHLRGSGRRTPRLPHGPRCCGAPATTGHSPNRSEPGGIRHPATGIGEFGGRRGSRIPDDIPSFARAPIDGPPSKNRAHPPPHAAERDPGGREAAPVVVIATRRTPHLVHIDSFGRSSSYPPPVQVRKCR